MDSLSIPRSLNYLRYRFQLSSDSWIYWCAHNLDFAHTLNYDLAHVEIVVLDFAIFTMKKSKLDSFQVAIDSAFAITVTFMASSYSCYLVAGVVKPCFAPLLGSNSSTSSGSCTWISLKCPCCCFRFDFGLFRFGSGGVFALPILSFLGCCSGIDFECFEFVHCLDCSCCNFTACSFGIALQDNSYSSCIALRTCSFQRFDLDNRNFQA